MITPHCPPDSAGAIEALDERDFYRVIEATSGLALVFFTSPGCASCRAWRRVLEEYLREHSGQNAGLTIFSVDAQANMGLVREYEVFHLPALFLFRHGQFHCELQCEARLANLDEAIAAAVVAPAQEAP